LPSEGVEYPLTKGNYLISDCYFEHTGDGVEGWSLGEEAETKINSCTFNKCLWPLYFMSNFNSKISILNNTFSNSEVMYDVMIEDNDYGFMSNTVVEPLKRCEYIIEGNTFNGIQPIPSIFTIDHWVYKGPEERLPQLFIIKNNVFNLAEGSSGICLNNAQDAVVMNNRFKGSCSTGILVDGFNPVDPENLPYAKNALLLGNNFSRLNSSVANIYLGEKSKDCTVIGSKTDGKVIDKGVNNKITGMTKGKPGLKLGPNIRDNFRLLRKKP
jgi:hypothetical protein